MLQEGKTFNGLSFERGYNPFQLFEEIHSQGRGIRQFYTGYYFIHQSLTVSTGFLFERSHTTRLELPVSAISTTG